MTALSTFREVLQHYVQPFISGATGIAALERVGADVVSLVELALFLRSLTLGRSTSTPQRDDVSAFFITNGEPSNTRSVSKVEAVV